MGRGTGRRPNPTPRARIFGRGKARQRVALPRARAARVAMLLGKCPGDRARAGHRPANSGGTARKTTCRLGSILRRRPKAVVVVTEESRHACRRGLRLVILLFHAASWPGSRSEGGLASRRGEVAQPSRAATHHPGLGLPTSAIQLAYSPFDSPDEPCQPTPTHRSLAPMPACSLTTPSRFVPRASPNQLRNA